MSEPTRIQSGGPVLRAVVVIKLTVRHNCVSTPSPAQEHGGLLPVQPGTVVRLDIGDARMCFSHDADKIAGAFADAAEIEVVGSNPRGVESTRNSLSTSLYFSRLRATG